MTIDSDYTVKVGRKTVRWITRELTPEQKTAAENNRKRLEKVGVFKSIPKEKIQAKHIPDNLIWFMLTHPEYTNVSWGVGHELSRIYPPMVVYRKLEKFADRGYIEYGTSLMTPWLTSEGKEKARQMFAELRKVDDDGSVRALYRYFKFIGDEHPGVPEACRKCIHFKEPD
jgi:hypothetical protein